MSHNYNVVSSAAIYYVYDQTNPFTYVHLGRHPKRKLIISST